MKRSLSDRKRTPEENGEPRRQRSVKWDEANLEENDKIKGELNPMKINEPKTPYHGPMYSDEEENSLGEAGMAPLTLEDDAVIQHLATEIQGSASGNAASTREDDRPCSHRGWSDSERGEHSSGAFSNSHSSCGGGHGDECESDPAGHRKHQEKRRRFEARRRQHYNMRDALRWGKELLSHEGDPPGSSGHAPSAPNGWPSEHRPANGYTHGKVGEDRQH